MLNEVSKSNGFRIRYSKAEDASELVYSLREADRKEILAAGTSSPLGALQEGFRGSEECFTVELHGKPVAMFGILQNPHELFSGVVWLLGAEEFMNCRREIVKYSKGWVDYFHSLYPKLCNMVWAGNEKHIRWLKWLGFEFSEPIPLGPNDEPFYYFWKEQVNV